MSKSRDAEARRLLQQVLPWAREQLVAGEYSAGSESPLGETTFAHITEKKLDGLHIYQGPKGGWHADITFRNMPKGIPNAIGSPVESPFRTRAEAEEAGKRLVVMALEVARQNAERAATSKPDPVFLLHDLQFKLSGELPSVLTHFMPELKDGYGSPLQAAGRIESLLDEMCPNGFDADVFGKWDERKRMRLIVVLQAAVMSGLYVYPMRQDKAPTP